ncbi:DUF397 domain-containing protein [Streptomyces sp. NPDC057301]|uniref:DUF397 domain-containing protein n=1 Tax=Streptomyces sp. NPDC057301 TaxID=3346093 RepID=UPI003627156B
MFDRAAEGQTAFWRWCGGAVNRPSATAHLQAHRRLIQDIIASIRHIRCKGGDPPSVGPKCNCIRATGCSFTAGGRPVEKPTRAHSRPAGSSRRGRVVWRKSSYSNPQGACVEAAELSGGRVWFRDSKVPGGPVIALSRRAASAFTSAAGHGEL